MPGRCSTHARNKARLANYKATQFGNTNEGRRWVDEDVRVVLEHRHSDRTLSIYLGRSVQAIQMIRTKRKPLQQ